MALCWSVQPQIWYPLGQNSHVLACLTQTPLLSCAAHNHESDTSPLCPQAQGMPPPSNFIKGYQASKLASKWSNGEQKLPDSLKGGKGWEKKLEINHQWFLFKELLTFFFLLPKSRWGVGGLSTLGNSKSSRRPHEQELALATLRLRQRIIPFNQVNYNLLQCLFRWACYAWLNLKI